jgi:hypothetical protein
MYLNNGLETCQGGHEMIYRTLGSTKEKVSAIGVGGRRLGLNYVDDQPKDYVSPKLQSDGESEIGARAV